MNCPRCNAHNDDRARFCGDCGTRIELGCPGCGQPVGIGKRFCSSCGLALSPDTSGPGGPGPLPLSHRGERILTSRAALEGERKQVTVLFADLKGSMEWLAGRDPEEARRLLDPVLDRMIEAVHRYEGTVNQVLGDGIMAIFGAPLAHEDHAVRACCAALAMQESLRRHAEDLRRAVDLPLLVRVGVNSGEVVVRSIEGDLHMEYTAVGQTTHLAARMEQMAPPGSVLVSVHTARLVEGFVELRALGPVAVKGLAEPVQAFEALRADPTRTRLQVAVARGLTPLVGRDAEKAVLGAALERGRAGRGQVVALVGEAGVGKSRLAWEIEHAPAALAWRMLHTGPISHGQVGPTLPLGALLRAWLDLRADDEHAVVTARTADTVAAVDPTLTADLPALLALLDVPVEDVRWGRLDPPQRRQWTIDALTRLLVRASQVRRPLLLVAEDLNWIDSETQAFLDALAARLEHAPLILLAAYRPGYSHAWARHAWYTELRLAPLGPGSAASLLDALLGAAPELAALKTLLVERTEGNPFFLEECARALVETGVLGGVAGDRRLTHPVATLDVPASVTALLAARIDRLAPGDKALLQSASVIGLEVPLDLLRGIAELPEAELHAGLARLERAEFLHRAGPASGAAYAFEHALTHEVAYGSLLRERRRALHARLVTVIEGLGPGQADQSDRLALHAFRGEVWERALGFLAQAGTGALRRSAYREAVTSFEQALATIPHLPETRRVREQAIDLRFDLRHALLAVGEHERAARYLAEAGELAEALDDRRRIAWTLAYQTTARWSAGDPEQAAILGTRALGMAERLDDVSVRVVSTMALGWAHHALGDYEQAIATFGRTLTALEGTSPRERFRLAGLPGVGARTWLAWCHVERGEFAEAMERGEEAVRLAEAVDHPYSLAIAYFGQALPFLWRGEPDRAVASLERGLALCRRYDIRTWLTALASGLGHAWTLMGRAHDAIALLREAVEVGVAIRSRFRHCQRQAWLAEALFRAGRTGEAADLADEAVASARTGRERGHEAHVLRLVAEIAEARGQAGLAATRYAEALALAERLGMRPLAARCHLGLARVGRGPGGVDDAELHGDTAAALLRAMGLDVKTAR